jgi:hypothetical protein
MVSLYEATLALMVISSPLVFIMLQYVTAPYGRHGSTGWVLCFANFFNSN